MLDQGFLPSARRIVEECPRDRQMALFSATVSPKVQNLITELFKDVEVVRSQGSHQVVSGLSVKNLKIADGKRFPVLEKLLEQEVEGGTIIFANTREQCDKLASEMRKVGHSSAIYRGEMDKIERRKILKLFREGKIPFLISTDLASRGLDVDHVGRVINYHLPQQMENYLHRVGRTARAGRTGLVINFVTERDEAFIARLGSLRSKQSAGEKLEAARAWPSEPAQKPRVAPVKPLKDQKGKKPGPKRPSA
jgi:superfamily II DNA/RNA helicase